MPKAWASLSPTKGAFPLPPPPNHNPNPLTPRTHHPITQQAINMPPILDLQDPFTWALATFTLAYVLCFALLLMGLRMYLILPHRIITKATSSTSSSTNHSATNRPRTTAASLFVVLGSGGHTKEMLTMLRGLDASRYRPAVFVRAASDTRSEGMVKSSASTLTIKPDAMLTVPRSRSVGQSWLTTPFTTLYALVASVALVLRQQPDVILCNGPGTCLPLCLAGYLLRFAGVKHTKIVFIESFCRVKSLSLTGKLLYYLADRFVVQWPGLRERYSQAEYLGQLC